MGPVIIYRLRWGGGGEDFRGDHLIFRRTKGGITENLWKDSEGTTQVCLENEDMWGGGIAKVIESYRGDHFSEVTFKRRIG